MASGGLWRITAAATDLGVLLLARCYIPFQPSMLHEEAALLLEPPLDCMMQLFKLVLHICHFVLVYIILSVK